MMKGKESEWPEEQKAAGERLNQAWDEFFSAAEPAQEISESHLQIGDKQVRIAQIRARYESELLRYPNVVGVAEGIRTMEGKPTGEQCLVVYVEKKIPRSELEKSEILPSELEGIPVDVVEIGGIEAL